MNLVSTPVIELKNISYSYGKFALFEHLSIEFKGNGIYGLLGPNGAGKSSLMKLISGLLMPHSGQVLINGKNPYHEADEKVTNSIGLLSDYAPTYKTLTVYQFLEFCASIREVKNIAKKIDEVLAQLDLEDVKHKIIQGLSTGYRQRVSLAQSLIHHPAILILDEPTSGLDPKSSYELRAYLKKISAHHLIIFSSHLLHDVEQLCDNVTLLSKGKIVFHGKIQDAFKTDKKINKMLMKLKGKVDELILKKIFQSQNYEIEKIEVNDPLVSVIFTSPADIKYSDLILKISDYGLNLMELTPIKEELEESFIHLINDKKHEKNI